MGKILIKKGDITKEDVDVIVNAANTRLCSGGGVDGAIHRAAGASVLEECRQIGFCQTGDAVMTNAGRLSAKKIIHTVGPVWGGGLKAEAQKLQSCYHRSFSLAKKAGLKRIAFPAISTGVYRYPKDAATEIAIREGLKALDDFDEIRYICFSDSDFEIYQKVYQDLRKNSAEGKK